MVRLVKAAHPAGVPMATYFVRQNGRGSQGPFEESKVVAYIAAGRIRPGMELSTDGANWVPVESHPLIARAAPPFAPPEPIEEIEEVSAAEARSRPARRGTRRPVPRSAPSSGGGKAVAAVLGLLVVAGMAVMASKGGSKDADPSGSAPSRRIAGAPSVVEPPKPLIETKAEYRARWTRHRKTYWGNGTVLNEGVLGGYSDEEVESKVTEISGRKPERTQTIGGRRFWYFPCSDGLIQLIWWKDDLGMYHYEINDY